MDRQTGPMVDWEGLSPHGAEHSCLVQCAHTCSLVLGGLQDI
jgi:hypothetical protein